MPYYIGTSDQCPADKPHAVLKEDDGALMGCHASEEDAQAQIDALYAAEEAARFAPLGPERRMVALQDIETHASGDKDKGLIVRGHAAVFDRLSLDLGGFRERIAPGAFTAALDRNPDVHLLWDHDTAHALARTRSKKYALELREDPRGLHFYANVAPTSYAKDLALLMDSGVIDQASFAFTVSQGGDKWEIDEDDNVTRTIVEIGELYDVTITAQGAYPQTDTAVVAHARSLMRAIVKSGRLPPEALSALEPAADRGASATKLWTPRSEESPAPDAPPVAPDDPAGEEESREAPGSEQDGADPDLMAIQAWDAGDQQDERSVAAEEQPGADASHAVDDGAGEEEQRATHEELQALRSTTRVELELAKKRLQAAQRIGRK